VKVQYPGIAETITADVRNVSLLRRITAAAFPGLDTRSLIDELAERLRDEVDYTLEADNQELFADHYDGHPTIHVPHVVRELSTRRVLTSELVSGHSFEEAQTWSQGERDLAGETIHRFVQRSLYRLRAFNGDPHPGNYAFHRGGRVTFFDFGLTKHFTEADLAPLVDAVRYLVFEHDGEGFRASLERAGFLKPGAPVPTETVVDRFGAFYSTVLDDAPMTLTPAYASAIVKKFFDAKGPLAQYSNVPREYVVLQRINLGLYAVLGSLNARANWRRLGEEMWPFVQGPASTPMGVAEKEWERGRLQLNRV
jgi:predicted unusual protein kinase regulating ubiquinone biosynthesis (AarF/ABC1/UbiB family)